VIKEGGERLPDSSVKNAIRLLRGARTRTDLGYIIHDDRSVRVSEVDGSKRLVAYVMSARRTLCSLVNLCTSTSMHSRSCPACYVQFIPRYLERETHGIPYLKFDCRCFVEWNGLSKEGGWSDCQYGVPERDGPLTTWRGETSP
jgi:hypothetical protein